MSSRLSSARALPGSSARRSPTIRTDRRVPSTSTWSVSPTFFPSACAVTSAISKVPGSVIIAPRSAPEAGSPTYGRNGPSANGSTPSTWKVRPANSGAEANPSTTGASGRMPFRTRRRTYSESGSPPGGPTT